MAIRVGGVGLSVQCRVEQEKVKNPRVQNSTGPQWMDRDSLSSVPCTSHEMSAQGPCRTKSLHGHAWLSKQTFRGLTEVDL